MPAKRARSGVEASSAPGYRENGTCTRSPFLSSQPITSLLDRLRLSSGLLVHGTSRYLAGHDAERRDGGAEE